MITAKTVRVFFISLLFVLLMVLIPRLVAKHTVEQPIVLPKVDYVEKLKPQLQQKPNYYKLKKSFVPTVSAGADFENARAYGVINFDTGEVVASKNLSERIPVASLAKIMTAAVSLDLASENEVFTVSHKAEIQPPTKVMLKEGEDYPLGKLLRFMLLSSANDSAEVIKDGINAKYNQNLFIEAMNRKAQFLGLNSTHFANVQGFDDPYQYSSVEDLAILSHYALTNYPQIAQIVSKPYEDLTNNNQDLRFYVNNWNGLLGVYPGIKGIKIGNTGWAGSCTVVLSEREGKRLLSIVLGAPDIKKRDLWAAQLLDLGFKRMANLPSVDVSEDQLQAKYDSWVYF